MSIYRFRIADSVLAVSIADYIEITWCATRVARANFPLCAGYTLYLVCADSPNTLIKFCRTRVLTRRMHFVPITSDSGITIVSSSPSRYRRCRASIIAPRPQGRFIPPTGTRGILVHRSRFKKRSISESRANLCCLPSEIVTATLYFLAAETHRDASPLPPLSLFLPSYAPLNTANNRRRRRRWRRRLGLSGYPRISVFQSAHPL